MLPSLFICCNFSPFFTSTYAIHQSYHSLIASPRLYRYHNKMLLNFHHYPSKMLLNFYQLDRKLVLSCTSQKLCNKKIIFIVFYRLLRSSRYFPVSFATNFLEIRSRPQLVQEFTPRPLSAR